MLHIFSSIFKPEVMEKSLNEEGEEAVLSFIKSPANVRVPAPLGGEIS
jgi:hypothetical protein